MVSETPEGQLEGQQTLADALKDSLKAETDAPAETEAVEPESVQGPGSDTPQQHRFRIMHEISNPGDATPHTVKVTDAHTWQDVAQHLLNLGFEVGEDARKWFLNC